MAGRLDRKRHLPITRSGTDGSREPLDDRKAVEGILFVLRTGIAWARLPHLFAGAGLILASGCLVVAGEWRDPRAG